MSSSFSRCSGSCFGALITGPAPSSQDHANVSEPHDSPHKATVFETNLGILADFSLSGDCGPQS